MDGESVGYFLSVEIKINSFCFLYGMDYIPYTQQNAEAFFAQLEQWNDEDEYTRCTLSFCQSVFF